MQINIHVSKGTNYYEPSYQNNCMFSVFSFLIVCKKSLYYSKSKKYLPKMQSEDEKNAPTRYTDCRIKIGNWNEENFNREVSHLFIDHILNKKIEINFSVMVVRRNLGSSY